MATSPDPLPSSTGEGPTPPGLAPAASRIREVPLVFWLGPKKLAAPRLRVAVEPSPDPLSGGPGGRPDLAALAAGVAGVYRPSEVLAAPEPAFEATEGGLRYVVSAFRRGLIDLTIGYDAYMAKFSGKTRSTLKRKTKKLEKASGGRIDWRLYRSPAEMSTFHELARAVSRLTYQEKLFDAGIPGDPGFVRAMLERAERGAVLGVILFLDGGPISYLYLPIDDGRVIYGYLGFDPVHAGLSPGTVLQCLALETLFAEGRYRVFDFTEGEGEHKRLFSTDERLCGNVFYLRRTARNLAIVHAHRAWRHLWGLADRAIARTGLRSWLRRLIRGQAGAPSGGA